MRVISSCCSLKKSIPGRPGVRGTPPSLPTPVPIPGSRRANPASPPAPPTPGIPAAATLCPGLMSAGGGGVGSPCPRSHMAPGASDAPHHPVQQAGVSSVSPMPTAVRGRRMSPPLRSPLAHRAPRGAPAGLGSLAGRGGDAGGGWIPILRGHSVGVQGRGSSSENKTLTAGCRPTRPRLNCNPRAAPANQRLAWV